jgi:hypothetical protein
MRTDSWVGISDHTGATLAGLSVDGVGDVVSEELLGVFVSARVTRSYETCIRSTRCYIACNINIPTRASLQGADHVGTPFIDESSRTVTVSLSYLTDEVVLDRDVCAGVDSQSNGFGNPEGVALEVYVGRLVD